MSDLPPAADGGESRVDAILGGHLKDEIKSEPVQKEVSGL